MERAQGARGSFSGRGVQAGLQNRAANLHRGVQGRVNLPIRRVRRSETQPVCVWPRGAFRSGPAQPGPDRHLRVPDLAVCLRRHLKALFAHLTASCVWEPAVNTYLDYLDYLDYLARHGGQGRPCRCLPRVLGRHVGGEAVEQKPWGRGKKITAVEDN